MSKNKDNNKKDNNKNNEYDEQQLASIWNFKFKDAMVSKAPYIKRWNTYMDAYNGDYFKNERLPEYRSNAVSNYIFSVIETIRPIMLDNDPKFQAMPRHPDAMPFSNDLQEAFMYEWDREEMNVKLSRELINTLVTGNSVFFLPWDSEKREVRAIAVNPFNIFPDPLATSVEDAEYIIYADYKNVNVLKREFPEKADKLSGGDIVYSELVQDNDKNARIDNQVLVLEVWTRDYEVEEEEIEGNKKKIKQKYPRGRVITLCPELGIVLSDKHNPYKDGKFPFVIIKDYDLPNKFWGEGEVSQLLSPQKHMNDLMSAIIDNAKTTANMPWIIDRNSGIGYGKITSRPGLVIRKNPGAEVRREQPPQMPMYVTNAVEVLKSDVEQVSGIHNTLKGENTTGVYTAQGILALQEAGQVRIRLKVKLMEEALGKMAHMWYSRMKQFWRDDRWFRISKIDGSYDFKKFTSDILNYDYDIKVSAGSTMPVNRGAMLDLMIRLAQTPMPDGQPLVDREAVVQYLPEEAKSALLQRMEGENQNLAQMQEMMQQLAQQIGQQMDQLVSALEQIKEESDMNNEQTFEIVEDITDAIEHVNDQILQLHQKYDIMEEEREEENRINQIRSEAYNQGYTDAERIGDENLDLYEEGDVIGTSLEDTPSIDSIDMLPDDILEGLEEMSDDELALLLEKYPNIMDLLR